MSSGDKIIVSIKQESEERIAQITAEADKIYKETVEKAEKQAQEIRHNGEHRIQLQSEKMLAAYKSREELEKRNLLLKTKRTEIKKAVEHIYQHMLNLPQKDYFDLVLKLAAAMDKKSGTVFFNSKDLKRMPDDMSKRFKKCGIDAVISDKPNDAIDSGFILVNGDIEENMSFLSIINDKREEIEDLIGRELFKD